MINIFPFHDNDEFFSSEGVCKLIVTDIDHGRAPNTERGEITFDFESNLQASAIIGCYSPSNAILFIIYLSDIYNGIDNGRLECEILIVSGQIFTLIRGNYADEYFTLSMKCAYSTYENILFIGKIERAGIVNDSSETLSFCMKFETNENLCRHLEKHFVINGVNEYRIAPNNILFPKLTFHDSNSIFQWQGVSQITYINTTFYKMDQENAIGDETPLITIAENIIIEEKKRHFYYSIFSTEFRQNNEWAFIIIYINQKFRNINLGQKTKIEQNDKIVISLGDWIKALKICSHEKIMEYSIELTDVFHESQRILLVGEIILNSIENMNIRVDKYNLMISFEDKDEIDEFLLCNVESCYRWYLEETV